MVLMKQSQLKKKRIKEKLQANKDDKFSYSLDKLFEYMGRDQVLLFQVLVMKMKFKDYTSTALSVYEKCIVEDEKHIYVVGDIQKIL